MYYFFDESGDWSDLKQNRSSTLLLGGIALEDFAFNEIKNLSSDFKMKHGIAQLHAAESSAYQYRNQLTLIHDLLKTKKITAFVKQIDVKQLISKFTINNPEEVFISEATDFISKIILGDSNPKVYWDMKLNFAYPNRILELIENKKNSGKVDFQRPVDIFYNSYSFINEESFNLRKDFIKKGIENTKGKNITHRLKQAGSLLSSNDVEAVKDFVRLYDFTYLETVIKENNKHRFIFEDKLNEKINKKIKILSLPALSKYIKVFFVSKFDTNLNFGIEIADFICNFFYNQRFPKSDLSDFDSFVSSVKKL